MSKSQVRGLFNREPEFKCKLRASDIWYIRAPDFLAGDFTDVDNPPGSRFTSVVELPDVLRPCSTGIRLGRTATCIHMDW